MICHFEVVLTIVIKFRSRGRCFETKAELCFETRAGFCFEANPQKSISTSVCIWKSMFVIGLLALGQCNVNDNADTIERRACALEATKCSRRTWKSQLKSLAVVLRERPVQTVTLRRLMTVHCLVFYAKKRAIVCPLFKVHYRSVLILSQGASSATIASAIGTSPQMPCEKQGKVDNEITAAAVVVGALSTALFAWSIINPVHNGEYGRLTSN